MKKSEFFNSWGALHGGAQIRGVVRAWLEISFLLCKPLAAMRVTPNSLSILGLFLGAGLLVTIENDWAIAFLALSLIADGLDGSLAILTGKVSKWGALLDGFIDRVVESLWAYSLYLLGAPYQLVLIAWLAAFLQEYVRTRAASLGVTQLGVVTIGERPIRASILFIALVARAVDMDLAILLSQIWAVLQVMSLLTVLSFLRPLLRQSRR
ncbi:MAG: CDP-alcohol phosphatidyltransferase family protein [Actinobacteria bacterium]|nr:CDP-alcohol phosphatidyltransferase family protein [Actinomycetota bacterium]